MRKLQPSNIQRPDFLDAGSPRNLNVVQLTADPEIPCSHVYMEAQIFSPDSRRFLLEQSGNAHQPVRDDPEHRYLLCDLENRDELIPVTEEINAVAPSFSPDGRRAFFNSDETGILQAYMIEGL